MQGLSLPEQRRNHANNLTCAVAIPPCPLPPIIQSGVEPTHENRAQNPLVGAVEQARIIEQ